MAPKRAAKKAAPPPPPPPPAESSDDETQSRSRSEDSEDEEAIAEFPIPAPTPTPTPTPVLKTTPAPAQKGDESESSDEEEEEPAPAVPKNQPPPPQKKDDSDASGSDEEEEEEDDDDDEEEEEEEEPTRAAPPSAPKKQPPQPQKQEDSDSSGDEDEEEEAPPPPPKPAPKKVAAVLKPPAAAETKKPGSFEGMWSTNDDVRILEALAAHQKQHGTLPQPEALVDVLAGKLDKPAYGSKELQNKVKSLRTRYLILSKRGELPSKEHDRRVLDLSKLVWTGNMTSPVDAAANAVNGHEPKGFEEMCELYPHLAEEVKGLEAARPGMCKREFGKMDDDKARAMDEKIKKQRVVQIKVEMRHADLVKEVTKALVDLVDA